MMTATGLTIADIAQRMGRPATALYYHVRILEKVGVLRRVGERPGVKRAEAVYDLVADRIAYPPSARGPGNKDALKAMSVAFRAAEKDLAAALKSRGRRRDTDKPEFFASRVHCRARKSTLEKVRALLHEADRLIAAENRRASYPDDATEFFSLTVALLPLRGRENR